MNRLLDYVFPIRSLRGMEGGWVTENELLSLVAVPRIFESEELRAMGVVSLDRLFAASTYRDCPLLKKAIWTFKFKRMEGVGNILQKTLCDSVKQFFPLKSDSFLCPVPLYWTRRMHRGWNQSEILARDIAKQSGLAIHLLLRRNRPTGYQSLRSRSERWEALRGAFVPSRAAVHYSPPSCVYLIDDLCTTGATMEECAKTLKSMGFLRVEGIVLAHG